MILFTILLATIIAAAVVGLICAVVGGVSFIVAFGDVFVFGLIIYLIVKIINRKKK